MVDGKFNGVISRRNALRAGAVLLSTSAGMGAAAGLFAGRQLLRGGPPPVMLAIAPGIRYERRLLAKPCRTAVHITTVELDRPTIQIVVTPTDASTSLPFCARTTSDFLDEHGLVAAVNGDYFAPWHCNGPFDYRPRRGEPVYTMGPSASAGRTFLPEKPGYYTRRFEDCTWYFGPDNRISTREPPGPEFSAISGGPSLVRCGLPSVVGTNKRNPQTAIACDRSGHKLWLIAVDGRQPGFSEGLSDAELIDFLIGFGAYHALRLDGGGSTTMVLRTPRGRTRVINSPIHAGVPGWQRPVANHLGIRVRASGPFPPRQSA